MGSLQDPCYFDFNIQLPLSGGQGRGPGGKRQRVNVNCFQSQSGKSPLLQKLCQPAVALPPSNFSAEAAVEPVASLVEKAKAGEIGKAL